MGNHRYGIRFMSTWPHISLGFSAHIDRKYGHLSLHLPIGVVIVGFTGQPAATEDRLALTEKTLTVASRAIDRRDDQLAAERALCDRLRAIHTPYKVEVEDYHEDDEPCPDPERGGCPGHLRKIQCCANCGADDDGEMVRYFEWPCESVRLFDAHRASERAPIEEYGGFGGLNEG